MVSIHCAILLHAMAFSILCKEQRLEVCSCRCKDSCEPLDILFFLLPTITWGGGGLYALVYKFIERKKHGTQCNKKTNSRATRTQFS